MNAAFFCLECEQNHMVISSVSSSPGTKDTSLAFTTLAGHDVRRDVLRLLHDYNRQNEGSIRCQTPFSSRLWK